MIPSSTGLKAGLVLVSAAAHLIALAAFSKEEVQIAGGADAVVEARLGNSFADMTAGTLEPEVTETPEVEPEEATEAEPPTETLTNEVDEVATPVEQPTQTRDVPTDTIEPVETATTPPSDTPNEPVEYATPKESVVLPIDPVDVESALPSPTTTQTVEAQQPDQVVETTPDILAAVVPSVEPAPPATTAPDVTETGPEPPLAAAPAVPEIEPVPEDHAVQASPRPTQRPEGPTRQITREQPKATPRGDSAQNARAGSAAGSSNSTNTQQSSNAARSSTAAGNAAVSNYPGQVMRRISRVRKPRVGSRGTATVSFSISANGGLAKVVISRSSGSARLDRAALQVIRKAAPFPKPPAGAQRNFHIQIEGRV
ncbi:MAG: TonB family protein [Pseudomonadota bacterium]